ncbi:Ctr copper transporter family-domain-containing protein [Echria macrotheca]|uniref:Copper transport protein n=1 Tax=Echria macrotheca TaxID=438768 RepID=A0AAJ0BBA5_9PEZI|nr:Ctr copper transporter family-domain-containing protein [Echria macrotheca]
MDHSSHAHHMDHNMDHGMPGHNMPGMDGPPRCSMNMLFTWDYKNICVVFRSWQITSPLSLVLTLLGVVAITAGYEALREGIRRYEAAANKRVDTAPRQNRDEATRRAHVIKSVLYGIQNFYAFMIMLIFMTYNGWIMVAVSVGAGLGYLLFGGRTPVTKDTACH